jgi:MSHA biogenesis protein MshM
MRDASAPVGGIAESRPAASARAPAAAAPSTAKAPASAAPASTPVVAAGLLPTQIQRFDAYATGGMRLLKERIAATRNMLQTTPDGAFCVELYISDKTDPARVERFLMRARDLVPLSEIYIVPLTATKPTRIWVVYGVYRTRAAAEEAARRLPPKYQKAFPLTVRDYAELRQPL